MSSMATEYALWEYPQEIEQFIGTRCYRARLPPLLHDLSIHHGRDRFVALQPVSLPLRAHILHTVQSSKLRPMSLDPYNNLCPPRLLRLRPTSFGSDICFQPTQIGLDISLVKSESILRSSNGRSSCLDALLGMSAHVYGLTVPHLDEHTIRHLVV
ncbi:hypothetical protein EW146_g2837 [Bondarzewia mesenterica]|uniref:Uncharacterized protein n=1 Tax=Bondarzewia mesenterica TaxID=1095465 RepID=A0A4S4LZZ2_9AGAM|nr:hypothetical protein EW146_g2837 [Bondarzewia mesenterica]